MSAKNKLANKRARRAERIERKEAFHLRLKIAAAIEKSTNPLQTLQDAGFMVAKSQLWTPEDEGEE